MLLRVNINKNAMAMGSIPFLSQFGYHDEDELIKNGTLIDLSWQPMA